MNLRKLSPSMLLTLGLACGDGKNTDDTTTVNACLSPPDPTEVETGPCLDVGPLTTTGGDDTIGNTSSGGTGTDTGTAGSTFGPCLSPEPPTGTDTDTGTDTGTGTESSTGMMGDEPPTSRAAALERVLDRGTLPPDVAARLRSAVR